MSQNTIGQRIMFLMEAENLSIRKFARALDVADTNIRNYVDKGSKPSSDVIEKILRAFPRTNPTWLILGEGEPLLSNDTESGVNQSGNFNIAGHGNKQSIKGTVQANSGGRNTQNNVTLDDCKQALQEAQRENEFLQGQIKLQEAVIAAKEETITLLRASFNRPN